MTSLKQNINNISKRIIFICFILIFCSTAFSQTGNDLPIIEDFEKDTVWHWNPWFKVGEGFSLKTKGAAHSSNFGLYCQSGGGFYKRIDKTIGLPDEAISWWTRFNQNTRLYFGIGMNNTESGYFLCVDPSTNTLNFSKTPNYTYPPLKTVNQTYKLYTWYSVEVLFNTSTNVTGKLYSADGKTLLNSITAEIPDLVPGGIAFRGYSLYLDDIRGGTRNLQMDIDTDSFAPKLGVPLILKNIVFETNKSILLKESYTELNKLVAYLKRNPTYKINLVGHTDNTGNEIDNMNLSKDRAKAVADYLIEQGINTAFIKYNGLGSSKPIASNDKADGRKINRRVECIIDNK